jgi:phosphomannomutase
MADLASIVKAYDIRGVVPDQLDEGVAESVGAAFVKVTGASTIVTLHDMRSSSEPLADAFGRGAAAAGADVLAGGLGSTDMLYYASGDLGVPGAMITASHNPAQYNGIKLCRAGAKPVGIETGLKDIQDLAERPLAPAPKPGTVTRIDLLSGYADHLRKLVDISGIRPLKVVVDAGNGMAGLTVPKVFDGLPLTLVPLYFELDGTFPNHEANPIDPANLRDLQRAVLDQHADLGLAFDGDADRCFVVDERGEIVSPSVITALIATRELAHEPGATVIHNLITSRAVPEIILEHGGVPVRTRVGHSFIKAKMAEYGAVFGGEHSGHFYFRDFWFADSGMLAALHVLAALGSQTPGSQTPGSQTPGFQSDETLSQLLAEFSRYFATGEINSEVADQAAATALVKAAFASRPGVSTDELDGLTVSAATWWFNLRPSNTEPLLRLNAEAETQATMAAVRDEVLGLVREPGIVRSCASPGGRPPGTPRRRNILCRSTAGSWTSWPARNATRRCAPTRPPASSSAPAPPAPWPTPSATTSPSSWLKRPGVPARPRERQPGRLERGGVRPGGGPA